MSLFRFSLERFAPKGSPKGGMMIVILLLSLNPHPLFLLLCKDDSLPPTVAPKSVILLTLWSKSHCMIFYFPCFYWNNIGVKHHKFITDSVNLEPILGFYLNFQFCVFRGSFNILCFSIPVSSKPLPCIGGSQPGAAPLKPWGDFFFFF